MEIFNSRPITIKTDAPARPAPKVAQSKPAQAPSGGELRREISGPLAHRILEESGIKPAEITRYRIKLDIDNATGRVVAEVRKKDSDELVTEVPSRTLLRQAAMLNEVLGTILDKPV